MLARVWRYEKRVAVVLKMRRHKYVCKLTRMRLQKKKKNARRSEPTCEAPSAEMLDRSEKLRAGSG